MGNYILMNPRNISLNEQYLRRSLENFSRLNDGSFDPSVDSQFGRNWSEPAVINDNYSCIKSLARFQSFADGPVENPGGEIGWAESSLIYIPSIRIMATDSFQSYSVGTGDFPLSGGVGFTGAGASSGCQIVDVFSGDLGLEINSGGFSRRVSGMEDWPEIYLGLVTNFAEAYNTVMASTPRFRIGFCVGENAAPGIVPDASVVHSLGWRSSRSSWSTTQPLGYQRVANSGEQQIERIVSGVQNTQGLTGVFDHGGISSLGEVRRNIVFLRLRRSDNALFFIRRTAVLSSSARDEDPQMLMDRMEPRPKDDLTSISSNSVFATLDEAADGYFNSFYVAWDRAEKMRVSQVILARGV